MKKRFLSLLLALSMTLGLSAPTLAAEMAEAQMEARIEAEIQAMEQEVYADVYRQLEEQNGLHMMDLYMEILEPKIRAAVESQYAPTYATMTTSNTWTQYAPNGGVVTYTMMGNVEVTEDYMDHDTTEALLDNELPGYDPSTRQMLFKWIVKATLIYILPKVGWENSLSYLIGDICMESVLFLDKLPRDSINACGGYACVISTTDPSLPVAYTVSLAWNTYPTISVNTTSVISGDPDFKAAR